MLALVLNGLVCSLLLLSEDLLCVPKCGKQCEEAFLINFVVFMQLLVDGSREPDNLLVYLLILEAHEFLQNGYQKGTLLCIERLLIEGHLIAWISFSRHPLLKAAVHDPEAKLNEFADVLFHCRLWEKALDQNVNGSGADVRKYDVVDADLHQQI